MTNAKATRTAARLALSLAIASTLACGLTACGDEATATRLAEASAPERDALGLPDMPSDGDLADALSTDEGLAIAPIDNGRWYEVVRSGPRATPDLVVGVRLGDTTAVVMFDMPVRNVAYDEATDGYGRLGFPAVAVMRDVETAEAAYLTYGDDDQYAYVLHVPAE